MNQHAREFAKRLETLRQQKGLSQYAVAKLTGLSKQSISRLEMGNREPGWFTVQLLAAALNADYTAFADPALTLPELEPARPRGRPRKEESQAAPTTKKTKTVTRKRSSQAT